MKQTNKGTIDQLIEEAVERFENTKFASPGNEELADMYADDYVDWNKVREFIRTELSTIATKSAEAAEQKGYKEGVKMLEWRINCDTLISELYGWKGCVDMAVDESLEKWIDEKDQREHLTKALSKLKENNDQPKTTTRLGESN